MMQTKLPDTQGSFFWEMRKRALENKAIDMSVGMTEFYCPGALSDLAAKFIRDDYNNYAPLEGHLVLRERISEITKKQHNRDYSPVTEITVCAGPVQAVTTAITTVVNEGDEVIILDPSYITYSPAIRLNGGMPVHVPLKEPGFRVDWEDFRKMITSKTRMIILNTPQNPTGMVLSKEDLIQLQRLTNGTGIYIVSDESFEHLAFDQDNHQSLMNFDGLASRSFIVSSAGSVFHINGWGLAWCLAPKNLMEEFRKIHEQQVFNVSSPLQLALAAYFEQFDGFEEINEFYQGKRNYFNRLLKGSPYIIQPTQGSYFQLVNYRQVSDEPDMQFANRLIVEAGVAATPLSVFMQKRKNMHYLRFCFAKKNETLDEVARRMIEFAEKNKK